MSCAEPGGQLRVGLLSPDLMVRSRVSAQLAGHRLQLRSISPGSAPEGLDLLLVDLNRESEDRLSWLAAVTAGAPVGEVICFGRHTAMAELVPRARSAGARRCVANSHLGQALERWLREHAKAAPRAAEVIP